ncbi:sensor histidine kinase [Paenibacillus cremeus]|uniref:histidine kinase n=1 Tax=Paenibacillus cremeus TaxID=2163881 RepID=A0A559KDJ7_9BACL|nr:HAMP domain-containing sensor histidine kinase [Paenibacillus cremeus]TVY10207.1 HAMP domain-containing histidine kinase [Paenibacillus cremeus]
MSIRLRLLLSYTSMLIVTIVLFLVAGLLLSVAMTGDVSRIKNVYTSHYAVEPISPQEEAVYLDVKYYVKNQPDQLLNTKVLEELDHRLVPAEAGLFMRKGSTVLYTSTLASLRDQVSSLPPIETSNIKVRDTIHAADGRYFTYLKFDFTFPDKSEGSVYMLKEVSPYAEVTRSLLPILIGVLLLLLVLTNGLLHFLVTRSIVRPLLALREAAGKIKEGELNFEVNSEARDEIGMLSQSFEDMRKRLKDSVDVQLQYEENRKELVSNISHDLKTPITTIIGYVEGIRDGVAGTPEKLDNYLATIHRKAKDMDHLIDELFLFSKLDLKKWPFTFAVIDLERYLQDYAEELHFDMEQKEIQLIFTCPQQSGDGYPVMADWDKLKRVIANIVGNSVKCMDKSEKRIDIALLAVGEDCLVRISDNGCGMPDSALPHIFDRFFREDASRHSPGTGLGLAIAKQIITEHKGRIWAESELGRGTDIYFTLPRWKERSEEHNEAHPNYRG